MQNVQPICTVNLVSLVRHPSVDAALVWLSMTDKVLSYIIHAVLLQLLQADAYALLPTRLATFCCQPVFDDSDSMFRRDTGNWQSSFSNS